MARRVDLGSVIGPQGPQGPQGNPGKDLSDEINDLESKVNNLDA